MGTWFEVKKKKQPQADRFVPRITLRDLGDSEADNYWLEMLFGLQRQNVFSWVNQLLLEVLGALQ